MDISSEQAYKMVEEKMARESAEQAQAGQEPEKDEKPAEDQAPEGDKPEDGKETGTETDKPEAEEAKAEAEEGKEPEKDTDGPEPDTDDKEKSDDTQQKDKKLPPRKRYTHEERVAHAFSLEKQKRKDQAARHREERAKLIARNKELEAELEKIKGLTLKDFGDDVEKYVDYRSKQSEMQNEVKFAKERIEREEAEEMELETERRIEESFPDEADRAEYRKLVDTNGGRFLQSIEEAAGPAVKDVFLNYMGRLEKYPIVLSKLLTDMDAVKRVFRDHDPEIFKLNLHQFAQETLYGDAKPATGQEAPAEEQPKPTPQPTAKPTMPVTGRQVTAASKPTEPVHDRAYWNEYLRTHR